MVVMYVGVVRGPFRGCQLLRSSNSSSSGVASSGGSGDSFSPAGCRSSVYIVPSVALPHSLVVGRSLVLFIDAAVGLTCFCWNSQGRLQQCIGLGCARHPSGLQSCCILVRAANSGSAHACQGGVG